MKEDCFFQRRAVGAGVQQSGLRGERDDANVKREEALRWMRKRSKRMESDLEIMRKRWRKGEREMEKDGLKRVR